MATPNVGILTTTGKALIDKVNSGQAKISFSKVVFSSMDNSQLSDTQIKALTAIAPQEVVVSSPQTTLDTNSGETRIRATGTNEKLADGVYVKTYGVFAKDDTGNEILYGVTVSPNPNYFPAYDGVTPQAVTYSYKTVIQETSNITMTNSNDVYVSQEDLTEAIAKIPQPDLSGYDKTDDVDKKLQNKQDKLGYTAADDSKVVHTADTSNWQKQKITNDDGGNKYSFTTANTTDLAAAIQVLPLGYHTFYCQSGVKGNPSSQSVRGIAEITTAGANPLGVGYFTDSTGDFWSFYVDSHGLNLKNKQDKLTITPADDSKVAHLSGANNFDTVPTVNNNPLLLASSLPSDLAQTSQQTNFTAGLQSGGVDVATAADLKSIEDKAWYQLDNKYITPASGYTLAPYTNILYKIDDSTHRLYLSGSIALTLMVNSASVTIQLGSIIKSILTLSVTYLGYHDVYSSWAFVHPTQSGTNLTFLPVEGVAGITGTTGTNGSLAYVTYDELA